MYIYLFIIFPKDTNLRAPSLRSRRRLSYSGWGYIQRYEFGVSYRPLLFFKAVLSSLYLLIKDKISKMCYFNDIENWVLHGSMKIINYGQINLRFCEMIKLLKIIQTLEKNPISVDQDVLIPLYMIVRH